MRGFRNTTAIVAVAVLAAATASASRPAVAWGDEGHKPAAALDAFTAFAEVAGGVS